MRILGILAVAAAAAVQAGDPPAAPVDPIAAAKKEFAAIKAAPGDSAAPSGDVLSRPEAASLPAPGSGAPEGPMAGAHPAPGGTGNWLVDAMERKPARSAQTQAGDEPNPGGLDLIKAMGAGASGEGAAAQGDPIGRSSAKGGADSVVNPLDAFMEGWISARDRGLLLPDRRAASFLGGIESAAPGESAAGAYPRLGFAAGAKDASNPYVADLNPVAAPLAAPEVPAYSPLALPDLAGGNPPPGPATKPFEVPRLDVPDFTQPTDDDKYFRQMKRF
jgi:hypothetical protein